MKIYNNEKAIISLTSWKKRIDTVPKTIYNLLQMCKGFHIVLVLSEDEFPQKENELPDNLKIFIDNNLIEILWVKKNYRSFKKILFTMKKYPDVPIISADDDCYYCCNYAEEFYKVWEQHKDCVVTAYRNFVFNELHLPNGFAALYPPNVFGELGLNCLSETILNTNNDDMYLGYLLRKLKVNILCINRGIARFHDEIEAMGETGKYSRGIDVLNILKKELN